MRKFTKEITTLLAAVAMGTTMGAGVESEEMVQTAGVAVNPDSITEPVTTAPPTTTATIGTVVTSYTTTTVTALPEPDIMPPLAGVMIAPPEITTTTEEIPAIAGGIFAIPEDTDTSGTTWGITTTTTTTTTVTTTDEPEIPPLMGDIAPADGDTNGDGRFNISDVVAFQKYLLKGSKVRLYNWYAADMNYDRELDVFDLIMMKRELIRQQKDKKITMLTGDLVRLSEKGYELSWDDLKCYEHGDDVGSGIIRYEYDLEYMGDRFRFTVSGTDDEIVAATLEAVNSGEKLDIREGGVDGFIARNNPPA